MASGETSIDLVVRETPLRDRDLPTECPYTLEQVLDSAFSPDNLLSRSKIGRSF